MSQFLCECKKMRGKLLSILLPVFGFIAVWMLWVYRDADQTQVDSGYSQMIILYLVINAIFLPILSAVMASRLMDVENKGNTYKLLCTLQEKSSIFINKLLFSGLHILLFFVLETALTFILGSFGQVRQAFPLKAFTLFFMVAFLNTLLLFLLQMFFSLKLENQLYPLFIGLIGSFLGLFANFFPTDSFYQYVCPWAYYTFGCTVNSWYDEASRTITYFDIPFRSGGFTLMFTVLVLTFFTVRRYFIRKDV